MKKQKNIFENKLQELDKLKIESKKEILKKKQIEIKENEKEKKLSENDEKKFLKNYDKERSELKKFVKEVNRRFYKKYERDVINPFGASGIYCSITGGFGHMWAGNYFSLQPKNKYKEFEITIFNLSVLKPYDQNNSTNLSLSYRKTDQPGFWSRFLVEQGRIYNPGEHKLEVFEIKDKKYLFSEYKENLPKAKKLAINNFMEKLTNLIKIL